MTLSKEAFVNAIELGYKHLRLRPEDRWSKENLRLKFESFQDSYPEILDGQFLWAMERWIQSTGSESFLRLPTWDELMRSLYQTVGGKPSRVLGFRDDLPASVAPTAQQLLMLPAPPAPPELAPEPAPPSPPTTGEPSLDQLWDLYLRGEFDPFPPIAEEGATAARCRALKLPPATVETSLLGGTGSVRSWNGSYDKKWRHEPNGRFTVTFPRPFFLEQHPKFRDIDFRDMDAFRAKPYGGTSAEVSRLLGA
jgi:hypothetical protein